MALAADPVISTTWTIANGAESPPIFLDGIGFAPDIDKFDFTVDVGSTGLEYDSVAYVNPTLMRFNFHGKANAGIITIQANVSAFLPVATSASNTINIVVPAPLTPQIISFTTPSAMKVKDADQVPKATSTSGLAVVLTSNTPSTCTIDFLKIHAVAGGTCSITATQSGNSVFSPASSVVKTFTITSLDPVKPVNPEQPVQEVTNLGSASYDPSHTDKDYVSVLVANETADPKKATLVKLLIPPKATDVPVVFLISAFSTDEETNAGYFVVRTKMIDSTGKMVSILRAPVEINIPRGAIDAKPSWSLDGGSWYKLRQMESEVLPPDMHAGYFVEGDGRIAIFSDYLMLFGFRKTQLPLTISTSVLSIKPGVTLQLSHMGGSGTGEIKFFTRTDEFCTVTPGGLLAGVKTGKCIVAANKEAAGIYAQAASSAITVFVQSDEVAGNASSSSDPNHSILCQELSYTLQKNSALVYADLCKEDAGETASLEIGTKSKTGVWSYVVAMRQVLDGNGVTLFRLNTPLKIGQIIRVKVEGKVQISTKIE